ncbi:MAG: hypothetical protein ACI8P3_002759 [Saprospiraceae bacterium]|jgi:hypothetical protein
MPNSFSWDAAPGAVGYLVTLENTATHQTYNHETKETSISLVGTPPGTYNITVRAEFADGSSSIIIEDLVDL